MAIPDDDVARVRAATDIVALIGEHSPLKRQGRRWVGLCPFHQEKTPSFSVNAEEGLFYCFGCQQSGDAITFVREIEHIDFVEAVRRLADRAGVTITEDESVTAERKFRAPLLEAMVRAVDFYHERLLTAKDAGPARDYLRSRGYDGEVVRKFRIGWAPDEWDSLAKHLRVPERILEDTGLGFVNRAGRQQDSFRARVIFPIFDPSDRPIALGGRILPPPPDAPVGAPIGPKYKNSQEGPIYSKRRTLYGLNWSKNDVIKSGEVIVCEGYTDVIGCFVVGMPRAVATCGTALAEEHFRLLSNFAKRIVLAYDADSAGQSGASRVYEWERGHQVDVVVAELPVGSDPGELSRANPQALIDAVSSAKPFLAFQVERALKAADMSTVEGKTKAAETAVATILEHPNELVRDQYLMYVADSCRMSAESIRSLAVRVAADPGSVRPDPKRNGSDRQRTTAANDHGPDDDGGAPGRYGPNRGEYRDQRAGGVKGGSRSNAGGGGLLPGMEALRHAVHNPELVVDRLDAVLFSDYRQRAAFEALAGADNLHEAIELAESTDPAVADLLRQVAVEEPTDPADSVLVQLVRIASNSALKQLQASVRLSPERLDGASALNDQVRQVRSDLDELDDHERGLTAAERLLAWLIGMGEEVG